MQRQSLFNFDGPEPKSKPARPTLTPRDPNVATMEKPRLTGQNARILEMLKAGPVTNDEIAKISRKYTSRISDLRAKGYRISCSQDHATGISVYRLIEQ